MQLNAVWRTTMTISPLFVLLLSLSLSMVPPAGAAFLTRRTLKMEYFEDCSHNKLPITFTGLTVTRNGTAAIINGVQITGRDTNRPIKISFRMEKCKDKSNPDTCEYHSTWKFDDMCVYLKLPFFKTFLDVIDPPMDCPMKKARHHIRNARMDPKVVEPLLANSNPNVLWKFHAVIEDHKEPICCLDLGLRVVNTRVKS